MEGTELRYDSVDGNDVALDRGRWQTVVDTIWNIQVPQKWNCLASRALDSSSRRTTPLNLIGLFDPIVKPPHHEHMGVWR